MALAPQLLIAAHHSDGGRDRRPRVPDRKQVIRRLIRRWKPANRALLAKPIKQRRPPGEHFVRVTLMPDVPKQAVWAVRVGAEIEDFVERDGQLDHAEVR